MQPTSIWLFIGCAVLIAACRLWLRRAWKRTQSVTAEPAWHEKWLGRRRKTASNLEDMNPSRVLAPLIFRGMPRSERSIPAWHDQWLTEPLPPQAEPDEEEWVQPIEPEIRR